VSRIAFRFERSRDEYVGIEDNDHECSVRARIISSLDFGFELYFRAYLAAGADEFGARAESSLLSIPIYPIIWFSVKMCNREEMPRFVMFHVSPRP